MTFSAERAARNERHVLLLQERLAPGRAGADAGGAHSLERLADVEKGVERAADLRQPDTRQRFEPPDHEVPPALERPAHLGHALLRAGERGHGGMLTHARGVARLLTLEIGDRLGERFGGDRPADPPAGHRIGLAHTSDHHGAVLKPGPERGKRDARAAVVDELVVDLV